MQSWSYGRGNNVICFLFFRCPQLAEQDELIWRDGSAYPEPCLDDFTLVSKCGPPVSASLPTVKYCCMASPPFLLWP